MIHHRKYAKWKSTYIHNCLKNGTTPIAGPIAMEEDKGIILMPLRNYLICLCQNYNDYLFVICVSYVNKNLEHKISHDCKNINILYIFEE